MDDVLETVNFVRILESSAVVARNFGNKFLIIAEGTDRIDAGVGARANRADKLVLVGTES